MSKKEITLDGMSRDEAIIYLVATEKMDLKDAKAYWKANRPEPKPSWKKLFYAELAAGPMTEERFDELVATEGGNVEAHKSAHKMVFEMANTIWAS